jgi:large subunit ribosomal protein L25
MLTLAAQKRDKTVATLSAIRGAGSLPAVVYGAHHESTPITIDAIAFSKILRDAGESTESTIVSLTGIGAALPTLIQEIERDPLNGKPRHVDFYAVTKGEKVEVAIPLEFVGESAAVAAGANLVKVLHEVEVKADPMNLPHNIQVDLSSLVELNSQIHASDLVLPAGIELITEGGEVVVLTQEVAAERVEEVAADISSIEVEKKGKEEATEEAAS